MKFGDILLNFCQWVFRFIILNFLWVIFMVLGGVVLGIMPSTVAMFHVLRKWIQGEMDINIFKTFKDVYKREFITSNKCGLIFLLIFAFLALDLNILYQIQAIYSTILYVIVMAVLFFVSMSFLYFFPTYVQYKLSVKDYIKNSFILCLSSPFETILILVGFGILYYIVKINPGLIIFFSTVVPSYWVMHVLYKKFLKLQKSF
ncbi:MAG: YesL family protein [Romboutsia sp.]|uniref:YesL family protein n=1 Tax=Romboutsia sp. TaxID=1965302 RepID=UPI003F367C72